MNEETKTETTNVGGNENNNSDATLELARLKEENEKLKKSVNNATSDAAKYKKAYQEKLTETEKQEQERAEYIAALEAQVKEANRNKSIADYSSKFMANGFNGELAKDSAEALADGDFDRLFANIGKHNTAQTKQVKEQLYQETPKPVTGKSGVTTVTKAEFDKMGYTEKVKLFEENRELYDQLNK